MRIAIIGAGISGLSCAWQLKDKHDITIYEAGKQVGGHSHTVNAEIHGKRYPVDIGFIVYNDKTYPHFINLLNQLQVPTQEAPMGFSVMNEKTGLQYSSAVPGGLLAQPTNLLKPRFIKMVRDILRFMRESDAVIERADPRPLGQFLKEENYSPAFIEDYLLPIGSAIWSAPLDVTAAFPVNQFLQFFKNHGLLSVNGNVQWRTITGGSTEYVKRLIAPLQNRIRSGSAVTNVERTANGVVVHADGLPPETFDEVVMACHSDQALDMLTSPTEAEASVLGDLPYQDNDVALHYDDRLLPSAKRARSGWNYRIHNGQDRAELTYDMNYLQGINCPEKICVSLNQNDRIDPGKLIYKAVFAHPVYTNQSAAARERWGEISGVDRIHYCGAYWSYGFHEDGVRSAVRVAKALGGKLL